MKKSSVDDFKAILFDLDGTLINVDLKRFVPEYLKLLASTVSHLVRQSKFISKLLIASEAVNKNDGSQTNEDVFENTFFPLIGYTREEINPFFDKFYEDDFSKLRQYTSKKPAARRVMEYIFKKGYIVVIATTPLLPETAMRQRLQWAGVGDFSYRLITNIENSYSNKPNLSYYQSILDYINIPAEQCLMVGDEAKDMVAANLGIKTYLIQSENTEMTPDIPEPNYRGTLAELDQLL